MKGGIRIGGALALGVIMILGAFGVRDNSAQLARGEIVVQEAPERTYIESRDSNNDGIEDWEEDIYENIFKTIKAPSSTVGYSAFTEDEYVEPTTFTGKFSKAFFQDYMSGKVRGADMSEPTQLVGNAVAAIEKNTRSTVHARIEVNRIESTPKAIRAYGNELVDIMNRNSVQSEPEINIFGRALKNNNPAELAAIIPIRDGYKKIIADSLAMPVPDALASQHVGLLNAYEAILTDLEAMLVGFEDPLYALARIRNYEGDANAMYDALVAIGGSLDASGVSYANDEPGALFYSLMP